jgi:anti-anti-sigma regulatory factor
LAIRRVSFGRSDVCLPAARLGNLFVQNGGGGVTSQLEHFRIIPHGGVIVVTPTVFDFLDQVTNFEAKRELIRFAQDKRPEKAVVDFHHVQRFSTEFIGTLLSFKRQMGTDGRIALCAMQPVHRDIFRVLNLDGTVFQIFETVEQAVQSFQ